MKAEFLGAGAAFCQISSITALKSVVKTIIIGAVPDRGGVPEGYTVEDIAKDIVKANGMGSGESRDSPRGGGGGGGGYYGGKGGDGGGYYGKGGGGGGGYYSQGGGKGGGGGYYSQKGGGFYAQGGGGGGGYYAQAFPLQRLQHQVWRLVSGFGAASQRWVQSKLERWRPKPLENDARDLQL
eukprot:g23910.t1